MNDIPIKYSFIPGKLFYFGINLLCHLHLNFFSFFGALKIQLIFHNSLYQNLSNIIE